MTLAPWALGRCAAPWCKRGISGSLKTMCLACKWSWGAAVFAGERRPRLRCRAAFCDCAKVMVTSGARADVEVPLPKLGCVAFPRRSALKFRAGAGGVVLVAKVARNQCDMVMESWRDIAAGELRRGAEARRSIRSAWGRCHRPPYHQVQDW